MAQLFDLKQRSDETSQVERLLNEIEAHEGQEEKAVEQYKKALGGVKNPVNRLVLQLVISDEEKHRAVTHAMATTLKGSLTWTRPEGSLEGDADPATVKGKLLAVTQDFIDLEKAGIKEYQMLLRESMGYYHGRFEILLSSMIRDSEKHVELLEFLRGRFKEP
jgi:rubrerythrin